MRLVQVLWCADGCIPGRGTAAALDGEGVTVVDEQHRAAAPGIARASPMAARAELWRGRDWFAAIRRSADNCWVPRDAAAAIETARSLALAGRVRDAGRLLRDYLAEDPSNADLRHAIARIYRETGHPDQAGRYEFFLTESSRTERAAYLDLLVAADADEARIRQLSTMPADVAVPDGFMSELADRRRKQAEIEPWDSLVSVGSVAFAVLSLITILVVYVFAVLGADGAVVVARVGGIVCLAALAAVILGFAVSAWIRRSRRAGAILTAVTLALAGAVVTGTVALVTQLAQA